MNTTPSPVASFDSPGWCRQRRARCTRPVAGPAQAGQGRSGASGQRRPGLQRRPVAHGRADGDRRDQCGRWHQVHGRRQARGPAGRLAVAPRGRCQRGRAHAAGWRVGLPGLLRQRHRPAGHAGGGQVQHAVPDRRRRVRPDRQPRPEERVPPQARLRQVRRRRHRGAGRNQQGCRRRGQDRGAGARGVRVRHRHGQAAGRQVARHRHPGRWRPSSTPTRRATSPTSRCASRASSPTW